MELAWKFKVSVEIEPSLSVYNKGKDFLNCEKGWCDHDDNVDLLFLVLDAFGDKYPNLEMDKMGDLSCELVA